MKKIKFILIFCLSIFILNIFCLHYYYAFCFSKAVKNSNIKYLDFIMQEDTIIIDSKGNQNTYIELRENVISALNNKDFNIIYTFKYQNRLFKKNEIYIKTSANLGEKKFGELNIYIEPSFFINKAKIIHPLYNNDLMYEYLFFGIENI